MDEPLSDREVPNILRVRHALRTPTNVCMGGYVYIGIEMKPESSDNDAQI